MNTKWIASVSIHHIPSHVEARVFYFQVQVESQVIYLTQVHLSGCNTCLIWQWKTVIFLEDALRLSAGSLYWRGSTVSPSVETQWKCIWAGNWRALEPEYRLLIIVSHYLLYLHSLLQYYRHALSYIFPIDLHFYRKPYFTFEKNTFKNTVNSLIGYSTTLWLSHPNSSGQISVLDR